eukprot:1084158-Amphidinium_carterae.2
MNAVAGSSSGALGHSNTGEVEQTDNEINAMSTRGTTWKREPPSARQQVPQQAHALPESQLPHAARGAEQRGDLPASSQMHILE